MKTRILAAAAACTLLAGSAALADTSQLVAAAGLGQGAEALSLDQIARLKFNAGTRGDDRIAVVVVEGAAPASARAQLAASAGLDPAAAADMSLDEIAAAKIRAEARGDDRQPVVMAKEAGASAGKAQLAASAGFDPEVARAMSVNEIFLAEIVRRSNDD